MIIINEIIGPERRCSNHTALSFGICHNEPLMRWGEIVTLFREIFGNNNIEERVPIEDLSKFLDGGYTIRQFIDEVPKGHFIIYTRGHAMAVHNGHLVDTARKGISRQIIRDARQIINHDRQLDVVFEEYLNQYPKNVFTKPKHRTPKYRFYLSDIVKEVQQIYAKAESFEDVYEDFTRIMLRTGMSDNAKWDKQREDYVLSKKQLDTVVRMYRDGF